VTIEFFSNFFPEYLSYENFNFEIKTGAPMLIEEQRGIENAPILTLLDTYYKNVFPVIVKAL